MYLYDYLAENLNSNFPWEDYNFDDADIPELKGNSSLLCEVWDAVNEWANEYSDNCCGIDAAIIAKFLNETTSIIHTHTSHEPVSISSIAEICSLYGRCCIFAKNIMGGSEYFEKCKFVVNNTIADIVLSSKIPNVEISDIDKADPEDEWETL